MVSLFVSKTMSNSKRSSSDLYIASSNWVFLDATNCESSDQDGTLTLRSRKGIADYFKFTIYSFRCLKKLHEPSIIQNFFT